jgi:hypothetical protein
MLPPFIIDQIRRREEEQERRNQLDRPVLELPVDGMPPFMPPPAEKEEEPQRGVVILELSSLLH